MEDYFRLIETTSDEQERMRIIENGKKLLRRYGGGQRLSFILELSKWTRRYFPRTTAEELIDAGRRLAETIPGEEAALIFCEKAFLCFSGDRIAEADRYAGKALRLSRDIGSKKAEAKALTIKGYVDDVNGEHKKATAWYTAALKKSTKLQRAGILLDLGTSLSKQGEFGRSWGFMNEAINLSGRLSADASLSEPERFRQIKILAESWSRLGTLNESFGDFDGAARAYDKALALAGEHSVWDTIYKTFSRKIKLMIMEGNLSEAERSLQQAESIYRGQKLYWDARIPLFLVHDRARLQRASKRYSKAMETYREILYGEPSDSAGNITKLAASTKPKADVFGEILTGIVECLHGLGKETLAESLSNAETKYKSILGKTGIYEHMDKSHKLETHREKIRVLLEQIFLNLPGSVAYAGVQAFHEPGEKKALFKTTAGKKIPLAARYFYIFKYLVDSIHHGAFLSAAEIESYLMEEMGRENFGHSNDRGIRNYVSRLEKKLQLDKRRLLIRRPSAKGGGWKLKGL